jgi:hypothetical protein
MSVNALFAQWAITYGSKHDDELASVIPAGDGGYLITGFTTIILPEAMFSPLRVMKISSSGESEWEVNLSFEYDYHPIIVPQKALGAVQLREGGFVVVGRSNNLEDVSQALLLKISEEGDVEWLRAFGGADDDEACSVLQTEEGGFIVAGWTASFGNGGMDAWIMKLDYQGYMEWEKALGGTNQDKACAICKDDDIGYIVLGVTRSYGMGNNDIWLIKIDEVGEIMWQKTYGRNLDDSAYCINKTIDGGYIIAGETDDPLEERTDSMIFKVDDAGEIEWQRIYRAEGNSVMESIQKTSDGGYIAAGSVIMEGDSDMLILKIAADGNVEWTKTFGLEDSKESASSIAQASEGHYVVAGRTECIGYYRGDMLVLNMSPVGEIEACSYLHDSEMISINSFIIPQSVEAYALDTSSYPEQRDLISTSRLASTLVCPQIQKKVKGKDPIR